jgi:hypothetical protein
MKFALSAVVVASLQAGVATYMILGNKPVLSSSFAIAGSVFTVLLAIMVIINKK